MGFTFGFVLCLCFSVLVASKETYRAAVLRGLKYENDLKSHIPYVQEAGKAGVDVLVLASPQFSSSTFDSSCGLDNYDELVTTLSEASKAAGLYVVAHLLEKTRCQTKHELVRSNLVFDRDGNIVSVYRKPINNIANCTTAPSEISTFTTDFGVTFGVLMEEDLVTQKPKDLKSLKNLVLTGWSSEMQVLSTEQFARSWAFVNQVNLISSAGLYAGRGGIMSGHNNLEMADLNKTATESPIVPPVVSTTRSLHEDLSLYAVKPLDLVASTEGYEETVCHGSFCCQFYVKIKSAAKPVVSYGLAAFSGSRAAAARHVGVLACALRACAGPYKRSCDIGSDSNSTNLEFEKISIIGNFTFGNTEYPIIVSSSEISSKQFNFQSTTIKNLKQVTLNVSNVKNLLNFGIFGRDYSMDSEIQQAVEDLDTSSPGYILSGEVDEFFDYLWIRLRILIFLVSIYVLEML